MALYSLKELAAGEQNPNYEKLVSRKEPLTVREGDIRTPYVRDRTRILHAQAFRRLKHKTQVFFNVGHDHVCTRIEHVSHVESVSNIIASHLGLDTDLTRAIAMGHDLGHAPFGHQGERNLSKLSLEHLGETFWHEKNGMRMVDKLELLENRYRHYRNLDLTWAVRDGIISHCGEVDENGLFPRDVSIEPEAFRFAGDFAPATWEGCVVKIADKIAYLGRDIEDAIDLGILTSEELKHLDKLARPVGESAINTSVITNNIIKDICANSSPERGITMSEEYCRLLNNIKEFNYTYIYHSKKLRPFCRYSELITEELFSALADCYRGADTLAELRKRAVEDYPMLMGDFCDFLLKFVTLDVSEFDGGRDIMERYENEKIYGDLSDKRLYIQAILDFLSGMTDRYAIKLYEEMLSY